tara:strand:- start:1961 stop:2947 length:987 start_codon:yes stop_codon:yes gene_type:complete
MQNSAGTLQHPRRNLGNRHRSQASKFIKLAKKVPENAEQNMAWAEQNAQQSILHDFTDERNWRCLAEIKELRKDGSGLEMVLEDLFVVLGRDPNQLNQLKGVDHLQVGLELLEAAFMTDSLDPEKWFESMDESRLEEFSERCKRLDFTDQRTNIIYGRRLEKIRGAGNEALFIDLVQYLLAHRPSNHELWLELGRLHERRNEVDQAWLCYDHVQQIKPTTNVRDLFLERLKGAMDGDEQIPWSGPSLDTRSDFLDRMQKLTQSIQSIPVESNNNQSTKLDEEDPQMTKLRSLLEAGDSAEAFFMARSLVTSGEDWAREWMTKAQDMMD